MLSSIEFMMSSNDFKFRIVILENTINSGNVHIPVSTEFIISINLIIAVISWIHDVFKCVNVISVDIDVINLLILFVLMLSSIEFMMLSNDLNAYSEHVLHY